MAPVSDIFASPLHTAATPANTVGAQEQEEGVPPVEGAVDIHTLPGLMEAISLQSNGPTSVGVADVAHTTPAGQGTELVEPNVDDDGLTQSSGTQSTGLPGFPSYRSRSLKQLEASRIAPTPTTPTYAAPTPATPPPAAPAPINVIEDSWSPKTKGSNKSGSSLYDAVQEPTILNKLQELFGVREVTDRAFHFEVTSSLHRVNATLLQMDKTLKGMESSLLLMNKLLESRISNQP